MTRPTAVVTPLVVSVAVVVAGCTGPAVTRGTVTAGESVQGTSASAGGLRTCGTVTGSTGVHRKVLTVHLNGPTVLVTGQTFQATVSVSLTPGQGARPVSRLTGTPYLPVITRGGKIVGASEEGVVGVAYLGVVAARHPFRLRESTDVALRGCATTPGPAGSERSRALLPPGHYLVYVTIDDSGATSTGSLLSEPHPLTVTARPAG